MDQALKVERQNQIRSMEVESSQEPLPRRPRVRVQEMQDTSRHGETACLDRPQIEAVVSGRAVAQGRRGDHDRGVQNDRDAWLPVVYRERISRPVPADHQCGSEGAGDGDAAAAVQGAGAHVLAGLSKDGRKCLFFYAYVRNGDRSAAEGAVEEYSYYG